VSIQGRGGGSMPVGTERGAMYGYDHVNYSAGECFTGTGGKFMINPCELSRQVAFGAGTQFRCCRQRLFYSVKVLGIVHISQ
jgi:hypothetical protein